MVCRKTRPAAGCAALLIVTLLASISLSFGQEKSAVPSDTAQRKALDLILEVYGEEQENAKSTSQKRILAKKLADKAKTSMDAVNRYVLLKVAQDLAAQAGDAELAFQAIDTMARRYEVDTYKLKGAALSRAAETAKSEEHFRAVAQLALSLIDQAVQQDDFEAAESVGKLAVDAARKARDTAFLKNTVARNKEVREIAKVCAAVRDARAVLKEHPVDPEANLAVGKYYCLMRGDWKDGILMLVLGSDEELKKLALKELKDGPGAAAEVEIGDGWWDMAEKADGVAKQQLQGRALYWYRRATPNLKGLAKDKVDKRLKEILPTKHADVKQRVPKKPTVAGDTAGPTRPGRQPTQKEQPGHPLNKLVTLTPPYPKRHPGAPADKMSVQYAVIELAKQAGLRYDWDTSFKNTDPVCRRWIRPNIVQQPCGTALQVILTPLGLTYEVKNGVVVLKRR